MTQEEYKAKIKVLNEAIRLAKREKWQLKKEYIETTCPYAVGDKVKIVATRDTIIADKGKEEFGFVEHIDVTDDGQFIPECAACKKDGTRHARNKVFIGLYSEITKL